MQKNIYTICILLIASLTHAQITNYGGLSINDVMLYSSNNFINNGELTNNGLLVTKRDYLNNGLGSFTSNGVLRFLGTEESNMLAGAINYSIIEVGKENANLILLDDATIENKISFTGMNTKFNLQNNTITLTDQSIVEQADDTKYIIATNQGFLKKEMNTPSTFLFPIGKNGYTPIEIDASASTILNNGSIISNVIDEKANIPDDVEDYITRYWNIGVDLESADFTGFDINDIDIIAKATYLNEDVVGDNALITATFNPNNTSDWVFNDSSRSGNNITARITSTNVDFTAANRVQVLPVKLLWFSPTLVENDVVLNWATASEQNNKEFIVEYSFDGLSFYPLETVQGNGNSSQEIRYAITHKEVNSLNTETIYYRLKQVDFDGSFEYSDITSIQVPNDVSDVIIYPNPVLQSGTLTIKGNQILKTYSINNTAGQIVKTGVINAYQKTISINDIPKGWYIISIDGKNKSFIIE